MSEADRQPDQRLIATKLKMPRKTEAALTILLAVSLGLIAYTLLFRSAYLTFGFAHGGFNFAVVLVMLGAVFVLVRRMFLLQRRWQGAVAAQFSVQDRLIGFNRMLAAVSRDIAAAEDDAGLLEKICDTIATQCPMKLVFICRPDESRSFQILTASGETGYAQGIVISADPDVPEGRGTIGQCWRGGDIHFNQSFRTAPALSPWQQRAARFGIGASTVLPLRRGGEIYAVLAMFDSAEDIFDESLVILLPSLAKIISDGLDRIDLIAQERRTQAFNQTMLDNAIVGIALTRDGTIERINQRLLTDLRAADAGQLVGRPIAAFLAPELAGPLMASMPCDCERSHEGHIKRLDDTIFWAKLTIRCVDDTSIDQVWLIQDITDQHDVQAQLEYVALHDPLTDLPNRYALEQYLPMAISRAAATGTALAVGVLDLDDFKSYNDTFGHLAGDRLLCAVGARLQAQLSPQDFFGRLGGDEFVLALALPPGVDALAHVEQVMHRLEAALRGEFLAGEAPATYVTMTLGLALYPDTTTDGDTLLRHADATLYQIKTKKLTRATWWNIAGRELGEIDHGSLTAVYGTATEALLRPLYNHLSATLPDERPHHVAALQAMPTSKQIMDNMAEPEIAHMMSMFTAHLLGLVAPAMAQEEHEQRSKRLGRIHALIGITSADAFRLFSQYNIFVKQAIDHVTANPLVRLRLNAVVQTRFSNELQYEQQGRWQIEAERQDHFSMIQDNSEKWVAAGIFRDELVQALQALSGVIGVAWGRPDDNDTHIVEYGAGCAIAFADDLRAQGIDLIFGAGQPDEQPCTLRAWATGRIEISANPRTDPRMRVFAPTAQRFGIRSAAAIPAFDETGLPVGILTLFGSHPNQFAGPAAEIWLRALQRLLQGSLGPSAVRQRTPVSVARRQTIRKALFGAGLHMAMQPIIDLRTGALFKVEALARLEIDGAQVSPAEFLPTFGANELQHLFRRGLQKSLSFLAENDSALPGLSIALNLPPSVLEEPDCIKWIDQALAEHGIEPARLHLELLELGDSKSTTMRGAQIITDLAALGVHLVMDDLGSGYSSLQRLRTLPFDKVKIDQQLIRQAITDPDHTIPFIGGLIQMSHRLGLKVVTEGLETYDLIEMAAFLGADYGQGYALSRPLAAGAVVSWAASFAYEVNPARPVTYLGQLAREERDRTLFVAELG